MKRAHLKLASLGLLFCMLLHTTGLYIIFYVQQQEIKGEMKQYLRHHLQQSGVTKLLLTGKEKNLEWENPDEFWYRGQMYDVIKEEQGANTLVYCVQDGAETTLVQQFLQQVQKETPVKGKGSTLVQLLTWHFMIADAITLVHFPLPPPAHYAALISFSPHTHTDIITPPPQGIALHLPQVIAQSC